MRFSAIALLACAAAFDPAAAASAQPAAVLTIAVPPAAYVLAPPGVVLVPVRMVQQARLPAAAVLPPSPFADMQRIAALMQRQADAMMRLAALAAAPVQAFDTSTSPLQQGNATTFIASFSGGGYCARTVQISSTGQGAPRVTERTEGNCAQGARPAAITRPAPGPAAPLPRTAPKQDESKFRLIPASAQTRPGASAYAGMIRPAVAYRTE